MLDKIHEIEEKSPKPTLSPPKCFQKRRKSENFEEKLKVFQQLEKCHHNPTSISPLPPLPQTRKNSSLGQQYENQKKESRSKIISLDKSSVEAKKSKEHSEKIASTLQLCDPMNKNLEARNIAPVVLSIFKIQKLGGKTPPDQSEETSKLTGPRETLIGQR